MLHWYYIVPAVAVWLLSAWLLNEYAFDMADRPTSLREKIKAFPAAMLLAIPAMPLAILYLAWVILVQIWSWLVAIMRRTKIVRK